MPALRILISGAGVAGPVLAHFLSLSHDKHSITIVERSSSPRLTGQNVDVRGNGLEVVRRMGSDVEKAIRARTTNEQGLRFVDASSVIWAEFPVSSNQSFTSEIEIMRGDLASILYEHTKSLDDVEYIFGEHISSLHENDCGVRVSFMNGKSPQEYDIVVGADGWASHTRDLAFEPAMAKAAIKSLGQYTAYFTIPYVAEDGTWAQWYNASGGRLLLLRPDRKSNLTRVWMSSMSQIALLEHALTEPIETQKQILSEIFADAGWHAPRIISQMTTASDFYFQKIAQIKLPTWSSGRVVLVGDAAYAPSPISGMGTTLGIAGAYILAGEICKHSIDFGTAFRSYEGRMRGFVDAAQKLIPGTPAIANPRSAWGIWILNAALWLVMVLGLNRFLSSPVAGLELPEYRYDALPDSEADTR